MMLDFLKKFVKTNSQEEHNINIKKNNFQYYINENKADTSLNLKRNDILYLTKTNPDLNNIVLTTGWDVNGHGTNIDLDLVAFLLDKNEKLIKSDKNVIYYGNKRGKGIFLNGDNMTGAGNGDDEKIYVDLSRIVPECNKIIFSVVIYQGKERKQKFKMIERCYVRLLDANTGKEICKYNLSEDGSNNTAIIFASLSREENEWNFEALGELKQSSMKNLYDSYK